MTKDFSEGTTQHYSRKYEYMRGGLAAGALGATVLSSALIYLYTPAAISAIEQALNKNIYAAVPIQSLNPLISVLCYLAVACIFGAAIIGSTIAVNNKIKQQEITHPATFRRFDVNYSPPTSPT